MSDTILAIDLGKFNSVLCWYEPDTRDATFRTGRTTPADLARELTRRPVGLVVFEACAQAGWVHDRCGELGLPAVVASTTGAAWQWSHVKRKTDRDDVLKLARLAAVGQIDPVGLSQVLWTAGKRCRLPEPGGTPMANARKTYTSEFKLQAVQMMTEQ